MFNSNLIQYILFWIFFKFIEFNIGPDIKGISYVLHLKIVMVRPIQIAHLVEQLTRDLEGMGSNNYFSYPITK